MQLEAALPVDQTRSEAEKEGRNKKEANQNRQLLFLQQPNLIARPQRSPTVRSFLLCPHHAHPSTTSHSFPVSPSVAPPPPQPPQSARTNLDNLVEVFVCVTTHLVTRETGGPVVRSRDPPLNSRPPQKKFNGVGTTPVLPLPPKHGINLQ